LKTDRIYRIFPNLMDRGKPCPDSYSLQASSGTT
jgi:hypothetical protein